jgi:hypothetical protein
MISSNGAFGEVVFGHVSHPTLMLVDYIYQIVVYKKLNIMISL